MGPNNLYYLSREGNLLFRTFIGHVSFYSFKRSTRKPVKQNVETVFFIGDVAAVLTSGG